MLVGAPREVKEVRGLAIATAKLLHLHLFVFVSGERGRGHLSGKFCAIWAVM